MPLISEYANTFRLQEQEHQEISSVRQTILNQLLCVFSLIGLPTVVIGATQVCLQGRWPFAIIYVFIYLLFLAATFGSRHLPYTARSLVLVASIYLIALAILVRIGLSGVGTLLLLAVCFMASIFFGLRGGMLAIFAGLVSIGSVAVGMITGLIPIVPEHMLTSASAMAWITFAGVFFMVASITVVAPEMLRKRIEKSVFLLEENKDHLEISNDRLLQEIEERKKAEAALMKSEERYRDLVENMSDAIYIVDHNGSISYISGAIEKMAGYRPQDMIGKDFREFFEPEEFDRLTDDFKGFLKERRPKGEYVMRMKTGGGMWVRTSGRPIIKEGSITGIQGILSNITDIKVAEERLKAKADELGVLNKLGREMSENPSTEAIVTALLRVTMVSLHPDFLMLFLREEDDLVLKGSLPEKGDFKQDELPVHRVGECLCGIAVRDRKAVFSIDINKDDRCTYHECKRAGFRSFAALPLMNAGEVIGVMGMASRVENDYQKAAPFLEALAHEAAIGLKNALLFEKVQMDAIELQTRLVQIEEGQKEKEDLMLQLTRAQKMEALGTLAGGIAHDFNNILTPIMMGTEFVSMNLAKEDQGQRMLKRVQNAIVRAKELVNQILTFSRQDDLEKTPMNVAPILKETIKLARAALPATIEIREEISEINDVIMANPTQIHQLIMNLISNAAHAMREMGGVLAISLKEEVLDEERVMDMGSPFTPGPFVKLGVKDSGVGMAPDTIEKIFDPFFTMKAQGEGTGLGLAMVHGIVGASGGAVLVESKPGEGSLFTVYLPGIASASTLKKSGNQTLPRGEERILSIDDELMIGDIQADILRSLGYEVDCQTDPVTALETFKQNPYGYDLIITDMTMPGLTGKELGRMIMEVRPEIPVILCTGFSEAISEKKALELGFSSFVTKPVLIHDIAEKIRTALDS